MVAKETPNGELNLANSEVKKMYQTSHQRDFQNIPGKVNRSGFLLLIFYYEGPRSDPLRPRTTEFAAERLETLTKVFFFKSNSYSVNTNNLF